MAIANKYPTLERTSYIDDTGRKRIHLELVWLTKEEKKFRSKPEDKE
jgi:hypothetical protein